MSSVVAKGALVTLAPIGTASIWNSTAVTPTLSAAVALTAITPLSPLARSAGALSATVGAIVSTGGGATAGPPSPPQATRKAAHEPSSAGRADMRMFARWADGFVIGKCCARRARGVSQEVAAAAPRLPDQRTEGSAGQTFG